ncbi:NAD(P)H-binding protein [Acinetobacter johnsonii]|uniref:NAD(P)H-binding protein n=1 Tax=Acinetobacter johnsonii TaxID=40214 RepID=UPI003F551187
MPYSYLDIIELAKIIRNSELMWTMVRLAILRNVSASRKFNVGLYGSLMHSMIISREDVAIFMYDQISDQKFIKKHQELAQ